MMTSETNGHLLQVLPMADGTVFVRLTCTAAEDAPCRRRPPGDEPREDWTDAEATETGQPCWARAWAGTLGIGKALPAQGLTVPVSIAYNDGLHISLAEGQIPHATEVGQAFTIWPTAEVDTFLWWKQPGADDRSLFMSDEGLWVPGDTRVPRSFRPGEIVVGGFVTVVMTP